MNQTMRIIIRQYQLELDDYKKRFIKKWGYQPLTLNHVNYRFLPEKKQKMCGAFWNHKDVVKCTTIIDCLEMVLVDCKSKGNV